MKSLNSFVWSWAGAVIAMNGADRIGLSGAWQLGVGVLAAWIVADIADAWWDRSKR